MSDNPLTARKCEPCEAHTSPMEETQARGFLKLTTDWELDECGKSISRTCVTKNFLAAVALIRTIADVAEADNHHPDIHLTGYRNLRVVLSTHAIGGLSENDFIVAAKIDLLLPKRTGN